MVLSDPAKGGLEIGAWIDRYNYQSKDLKNITITKNKSPLFIPCSVSYQTHVIPYPVISAILDFILKLYNTESNNLPVKFSKYNRCWKLLENSY